jgi:hypothetical protein
MWEFLGRPTWGWVQVLLLLISVVIAVTTIIARDNIAEVLRHRADLSTGVIASVAVIVVPLALAILALFAFATRRRMPLGLTMIWVVALVLAVPGLGFVGVLWLFRDLGKGSPY